MAPAAAGRFAEILAARRGRYNAQFAEARRYRPALDAGAFSSHLASVVGPIVQRVAEQRPEQAQPVADALYELSLDLVGREFLGAKSRYPAILDGWSWLLPQLHGRLAEAPRRFPGAVTNALYHLAATPEARPREWMQALVALSAVCGDVDELLGAAQVAAWRAGLAHYRLSALEHCRALPPTVAGAVLGLPAASLAGGGLSAVINALLADPWLDPAAAAQPAPAKRQLALVKRAGAFRGFGGLFVAPPMVSAADGQLLVSDGDSHWLLFADRFGASFQRAETPSPKHASKASPASFRLALDGTVSHGSDQAQFPIVARSQSSAATDSTLAVTTPLSHAVFMFALVAQ